MEKSLKEQLKETNAKLKEVESRLLDKNELINLIPKKKEI